ncbi:MAG: hypothetical protein HT580_14770 [Dechloromonas sp.]|nr:MAG: hypothetical protein HT580_14770 [Dechloromonas sp.]
MDVLGLLTVWAESIGFFGLLTGADITFGLGPRPDSPVNNTKTMAPVFTEAIDIYLPYGTISNWWCPFAVYSLFVNGLPKEAEFSSAA